MYFDATGAIRRDFNDPGMGLIRRTGFYEGGVKRRELTDAEFQQGLAGARKLASMTGAAMLWSDPQKSECATPGAALKPPG